jgi:hypothetical protein
VLAGTAPDVQHPTRKRARVGQLSKGGLGPADVPWRCPRVERVELFRTTPPQRTRQPVGTTAVTHNTWC